MITLIIAMTVSAMLMPDHALAQSTFTSDIGVAPQVDAEVVFVVRETADVATDRIRFSDIAECQGARSVCEETYAIYLGDAPEAGRSSVLSAEKVAELFAAEWPQLKFSLTGARFVRVQGAMQEVGDETVAAALRSELAAYFFHDSDTQAKPGQLRVTLHRLGGKPHFRIRPGDFKIVFPELSGEVLDNDAAAKRYFSARQRRMQLEFRQEKSVIRDSVMVEFKVSEFLPVAANDLVRGEIVTDDDVRMAWVETDRDAGSFVSSEKAVGHRRLRHAVIAGRPFEPGFLEIPMVAKKGQMARMIVKKGDMVIHGQVKLLANGGYGQIIDAQYAKTKKKVRVRVVDSENVQLVF